VTEQLLLHHFGTVDLLEPSVHLLKKARAVLCDNPHLQVPPGHKAGHFFRQGLETFAPQHGRYDCIWIQWCLLYLTDDDVVAFLQRAALGLRVGGLIVVKENICQDGFIVDRSDSSLTRSNAYLLGLFSRSQMSVLYNIRQKGMPQELFEVRMLVLKPWTAAAAELQPASTGPAFSESFSSVL
jgi:protein N-terminal methyltransferase